MKIAVLGAPGAGKSAFAAKLDIELAKLGYEPFLIIDNYVKDLQADTGLEYGGFGDFIDDMQVAFKRRECELMYGRNDQNTITVGTVLDSTIHNFIRTEDTARTREEIGTTTQKLQAIAAAFGLVYTESWDYDYAFVLRTDDKMGRALIELLATYRAPVLSFLPEVPDDEKASTAADAIRALESSFPTPPEERGVRRGSEASESDGDSPEQVPDVREPGRAPDDS